MKLRAFITAFVSAAFLAFAFTASGEGGDIEPLVQKLISAVNAGDYARVIQLSRDILAETDDGTKLPPDNLLVLESIVGSALLEMG